MPAVATIPVTIQPDADAFLAEIGMERDLERMLDHAKATISHLYALEIVLDDFPETSPPSLTIYAHRVPHPIENDHAWLEFGAWRGANFPPEVIQNMGLLTVNHTDEG